MDFRDILTRLRLEQGMTQAALAEKMGVSLDTVVQWENGDSEPPIKDLLALSDALEVSVDTLLGKDAKAPGRSVLPESSTDNEEPGSNEITICPCCGREVQGSICLACEFSLTGYTDRGPRYAVVVNNFSSEAYKEEKLNALFKYCGIGEGEYAAFLEQHVYIVARRNLTDVAAYWIASHLDPDFFAVKIVEDLGEATEILAKKPQIIDRPTYALPKDNGIGFWGVVLAVIVALIILSFL